MCGNCGEELEAGFTFCPACACVVSKKTALPPPQVEDEPPEQQAPLYAALNSLHGSIGLDKDQLAGLSAARNEEINHSRQRRAPEHKTRRPTKKQSWREPPLQHPTVWRPMGKVRPPPAKLRVSATEPAMASRPDEGRLPRGGSTKRGGGIKGRASRSQLSGADSSFGEAAEQPAGQEEQEHPAELSFAQQTALATGGFRRGNVVFAPQGWADRAAEAAALVKMEEEMRERNHMMAADAETMSLRLEEMKDPLEALLSRSVAPGRHQILSRALNIGSDALAILVAIHIIDTDHWLLEIEAYSIRNTDSGEKAPTGQPQLALALELSMGEVLAMLKDKASFVNPLQVSIIYFRAQGTKLPGL